MAAQAPVFYRQSALTSGKLALISIYANFSMKRPLSTVSLRVLMLALIGLLGAVALLFAVRDFVQSREMALEVASLVRQNAIADHGMQAIKAFALSVGEATSCCAAKGRSVRKTGSSSVSAGLRPMSISQPSLPGCLKA